MCLKRIKNRIKPPPKPLELPYPEEAEDKSITEENLVIQPVRRKWLVDYRVLEEHWGYWENEVEVIISKRYGYAASSGLTKRLWLSPSWANSGILAHEYAQISYWFLTREQKAAFAAKHEILRDTHPLLRLAYETKPYMSNSRIDTHADTYRYLGDKMPEQLKKYYPKLLF